MAVFTGWSLGYAGVYFRSKEYQRYFPVLITLVLLIVAYKVDSPLLYVTSGNIACILTVIFTYDPVIGGGYKIFQEQRLNVGKAKVSKEESDIINK